MLFLLPLVGAAILGVAAAASVKRVDPVHRGVLVRLDKRHEDRVYGEGWHGFWDGVMPFIDRIAVEPVTLQPMTITTKVLSKDNLQLTVGGSVQFRVDDVYRHMEMDLKTIEVGMRDAIESELGIIAGKVNGDQFKAARREVQLLINSVLRFGAAPHCRASAADPATCDLANGDQEVEPHKRISFYRKNGKVIRAALKLETENADDRSDIEARYGIDVVVFELAEVDFTPETVAALEKKRQAELGADAAQGAFKRQMAIFHELKEHVGPERALNEASLIVGGKDRGNRRIISVEGFEGVGAVLGDALQKFLEGRSG